MGVHVGCVITYPDEFIVLNKNNFVCRALDNRMGGFMIAEVARLLHENKKELPFGLYITNSVQEEIGLRGAQMITGGSIAVKNPSEFESWIATYGNEKIIIGWP